MLAMVLITLFGIKDVRLGKLEWYTYVFARAMELLCCTDIEDYMLYKVIRIISSTQHRLSEML